MSKTLPLKSPSSICCSTLIGPALMIFQRKSQRRSCSISQSSSWHAFLSEQDSTSAILYNQETIICKSSKSTLAQAQSGNSRESSKSISGRKTISLWPIKYCRLSITKSSASNAKTSIETSLMTRFCPWSQSDCTSLTRCQSPVITQFIPTILKEWKMTHWMVILTPVETWKIGG